MIRWTQGSDHIDEMLADGRLRRRADVSLEMNHAAFADLERKFVSMDALLEVQDFDAVVSMAHDVARKSMSCVLREQGLEAPSDAPRGHHRAVEEAALAQFGTDPRVLGSARAEIRELRLGRHDSEYSSELLDLDEQDAVAARETARSVYDAIAPLLGKLRLF